VDHVFAGVDSVALEYRFAHGLHGIEIMTVDADGLVTFAVGNDVVREPRYSFFLYAFHAQRARDWV
jgi:hypothetical protein